MLIGSLYVIWFYRVRRPRYYQTLVGKKKGKFEAVNVLWVRSARERDELLDSVKAESAVIRKLNELK
jgi:hypothetical protein